ncbi:glycosyltransferase family 25 protein [Pseudorhodoferax sp.]|uniref:glycosyltransferase family 25 protein n=1 Tax=Pseudorhodoferax sp. TaxID=1993553 RepID=UPI002DD68B91|nr:glycosyltransferase family 25 protein [Pseudorhodoferax sp.]
MADLSALPPIRYVNLDRDGVRRAAMEAEFARLGLHAERFPAVLWSALAPEAQARYYSEALNRRQHHLPLVGGEKGCYASHLQLWRWLLDSPHACAVVLEDDVALEDRFAAVCAAIAAWPEPWHMVKLIGREGLGRAEKQLASQPLVDGHEMLRYRRIPSLTAGYLLHREGARRLLAARLPFGRPIDVDLRHWWECGADFRLLGVRPAAIRLADTSAESSINAPLKALPWPQRWRKFVHKARYTLANHRHRTP